MLIAVFYMILTVIPIDKYNLFSDCDFVNSLENKKIHKQELLALENNFSRKPSISMK